MVVVVPQTVIVQRWVPWWSGQSSHRWKNWHESDFAGRAAAAVRRTAQASSKTLVLFVAALFISSSPWAGSHAMGLLFKTVQRMR